MLDANLQSQLKTYLERVTRPIEITAHADDGAKSQEMLELLQTLESLSDKISLQVLRDGQGRVPSFDLGTPGQDIHLPSPACRWATNSPRWCWRCCRSAATRPRPRRADRADAEPGRRLQLRDLLLAVLPELPGRGAGAEPDGGAQPAHPARGHRRRPVPGRSREARDHGGADRVPQR
jgi:hypothetical protein